MPPTVDLVPRVRNAIAAVMPRGVRPEVTPISSETVPTFNVVIHAGSAEHRFVSGWAGEGWPADVKRFIAASPTVEVVVGKKFSRGSKDWMSLHHRGWIDESGDAYLNLKTGLVILRESRTSHEMVESPIRWTKSMLTAAEAVLAGTPPTVEAVEEASGISRGSSNNALSKLESLGLLKRSHGSRGPASARYVANPDALLEAYTAAAALLRARERVVRIHRLWKDALSTFEEEIAPSLNRTSTAWALTGNAASVLLAPYLSDVTIVELYVDDDLFADRDRLSDALGGRPVDRGHVIEVRALPTSMSAMGPTIHGMHVALPARVYADLIVAGGRSAEAAQHLRESVNVRCSS